MDSSRVGFTYRSARSGSLLLAFALAIVVETAVLELWLGNRHPAMAWLLIAASVATLLWLAADFHALGTRAVTVEPDVVHLNVGRRVRVQLPRSRIASAVRPAWRDLPAAGSAASANYVNLTRPAAPNVLLTLTEPAKMRLVGRTRRVQRVALRLDDPDAFLAALAGGANRE